MLQVSDKDVFGNKIGLPLSARAQAELTAHSLQGTWVHEGKESAVLNLSRPVVSEGGLLVAEPQLLLAGCHTFRISHPILRPRVHCRDMNHARAASNAAPHWRREASCAAAEALVLQGRAA